MKLLLFTDGSVNPKQGVGFGAYLELSETPGDIEKLRALIKIKRFENTSSAKLELQTLLWALSQISNGEIVSYTDSQNIAGLLSRKKQLEENNFCSKNGRPLRNAELYREFFEKAEKFDIQFRHVNGHKPSRLKNSIDTIFSLVDRASRNALRTYCESDATR